MVWNNGWQSYCIVTCLWPHAGLVWAPGTQAGRRPSGVGPFLVGCKALRILLLALQDPLDSCEAIVGAAQPRRAARAQVNNPDASYAGMSPVARRVLFGASGEETMPGERGNNMAMSELVVCCLSII